MLQEELVKAVAHADVGRIKALKETIRNHDDPWRIHLFLFPLVQRVLNPPFINPHLPKMYSICRDFLPYLSKEGLSSLIYLELLEYARRAKLEEFTPKPLPSSKVSFVDIEKSVTAKDREEATLLLGAFLQQQGGQELLRRLLLLGSGYLDQSLGHSVSCTAFILLEIIERASSEATPALFLLADYFCKGGFQTTPPLLAATSSVPIDRHLARAVTGTGFLDLHHTITLYAIERTKSFFTPAEQGHLIAAWLRFVGDKQEELRSFSAGGKITEYARFYASFAKRDAAALLDLTGEMIVSPADRFRLCSFLVTSVCDLYQGDYNPHYLTGLGALFWVINAFHHNTSLVRNALFQYLDFYFENLKLEN